IYKEPPGEVGQLKLMIRRVEEKREELRQKRRDLEETLAELDQAEESCVERLAELGVNT
ncbi:MAG: MerR family transcriptional regulator, partial [Mesorhizobium sp.]